MRFAIAFLALFAVAPMINGCPEEYQPQEQDEIQQFDGPLEERSTVGYSRPIGHGHQP